jgi:Fur family ferric uptake transcriptional regulator
VRFEAAVRKIRRCGYRATPQRIAVLAAIAAGRHQDLEEIRARCPEVGMVTVYRTLDLLCGLGLVRRLDLGRGPRYEVAENHHHHLICEGCGSVAEFETCPVELQDLPGLGGGFEVHGHSLEVYGRCSGCT